MLGWDIASLTITDGSGIARSFDFEVAFTGSAAGPESLLRGDGVLLSTGRVRFNREAELHSFVTRAGGNPQYFLDYLADVVARRARPPLARTA